MKRRNEDEGGEKKKNRYTTKRYEEKASKPTAKTSQTANKTTKAGTNQASPKVSQFPRISNLSRC